MQPPSPRDAWVLLERLKEAGVRHMRASWWDWSAPADWFWYGAYRDAGIEVMPILLPRDGNYERSYARFSSALGNPPLVQLGNEPDAEGCSFDTGREEGVRVRRGAQSIRSLSPSTLLVGPGMGWTQPGVRDFIRGLLQEAGGSIDVFSVHLYGHHPFGEPLSRHRIIRDLGWSGPLWSTELGQQESSTREYLGYRGVPSPSEAEIDDWQRQCWSQALSQDEERSGWDRVYGFQLTPDHIGCGILRADYSPKPAYLWLQGYLNGR